MLNKTQMDSIRTWASAKNEDPDSAKQAKQASKFAVLLALDILERMDGIEAKLSKKAA